MDSERLVSLNKRLDHFASMAGCSSVKIVTANPTAAARDDAPKPFRMVLLGAPGCGKGTFAKLISAEFGIPAISTGDLIRSVIKSGDALAKKLFEITSTGGFVMDDIIVAMVKERISHPDCKPGFILDGFPRTIAQAKMLEELTEIDVVVNINLREDVLFLTTTARRACRDCGQGYNLADIKFEDIRMTPLLPKREGQCDRCDGPLIQRSDDKEDVVRHRLQVYHTLTAPLITHYESTGHLLTFDVKQGKKDWLRLKPLLSSHRPL